VKQLRADEGLGVSEEEMLHIRPEEHSGKDIYKMMIGLVVPRPIAFVSTVSVEGVRNLAPFSFYNAICGAPPVVCFSIAVRAPKPEAGLLAIKDTLRNIRETGEFVINVVTENIAEGMNAAAAEVPAHVDEFAMAGLTPLASEVVQAPRVAEARAQMECRLLQVVPVGRVDEGEGATLVIGQVVRFHVRKGIFEKFRIDPDKLQAVGRMAGNSYIRTREHFELIRPHSEAEARASLHAEEQAKSRGEKK